MLFQVYSWEPIDTAPEGEPLWLKVTDRSPEQYALPFSCIKKGTDFFTESGNELGVTPVEWRSYLPHTVERGPRYKERPTEQTVGARLSRFADG